MDEPRRMRSWADDARADRVGAASRPAVPSRQVQQSRSRVPYRKDESSRSPLHFENNREMTPLGLAPIALRLRRGPSSA